VKKLESREQKEHHDKVVIKQDLEWQE